MRERPDFDLDMGVYLQARATSGTPEGLLEAALTEVGTTRQRPAWLLPDRWLPARTQGRAARGIRVSGRLAVVALIIAVIAAALLIVGSQPRVPAPFGLAKPGLIVIKRDGHISVMNANGTGLQQLTFGTNSDFRPTWSPDGTLIAYKSESGQGSRWDVSTWATGGRSHQSDALMVVSADGRHRVTIADQLATSDAGAISWAPDSRRLAFAASDAERPLSLSHIYIAEADRPGAKEIGGPELAGFEPAWSPDGKKIAFYNLNPVDALWLMNADGSNAHRLTKMSGSGWAFWNAQWSPDGMRLLVKAGEGLHGDVWVVNADGSGERNITNSVEDEWWPTWSPDGAKVAFVRMDESGHGSFVVANPDGSDPVTLMGPSVDGNMPIWSPDGTKLIGFDMANGQHDGIVIYDLSGKTPPKRILGVDDGDWQRLAD